MFPLNKHPQKIPKEVQEELDNGWNIIWQNKLQILIGRAYQRKVWDFDLQCFFKVNHGFTYIRKKEE